MAYLKFSRDNRGYEHFCLVQPAARGKGTPRVLYWFRTPPNLRVGRSPFDPEIRRALEAQNPDVVFDWARIAETPIPPAFESERWRERRRVERDVRAAKGRETEAPTVIEKASAGRTGVFLDESARVVEPTAGSGGQADESVPLSAPPDSAARVQMRRRRRRRRRKGGTEALAGEAVGGTNQPEIQDSGEDEDDVV